MITSSTSLRDVSGAVASALRSIGYDPVVVGGSAATLHAVDAYCSLDIDMVVIGGIDRSRQLIGAMFTIGFTLIGTMFVHATNAYTVDFVPSPVAIGDEVISDFATIGTAFGDVLVLHATDAVCDRLNKFAAWRDYESFETAVAVAMSAEIDLERVDAFMTRQARAGREDPYAIGLKRFMERIGRQ